jgi:glycosyltransferase involved in cell wall biosynthesis
MTKATVLIAAWQAAPTLGRALDSIRACRGGADVDLLVVDDGSADATAAVAQEHGARVLSIAHAGRAAALNAGLAAITDDVVLFTDADCLAPVGWIEDSLAALAGRDGVGGNLWPTRFTAVELAKVLRYVEEFENDIELAGDYRGVCLNGNNMAVRKAALDAVGAFDPLFAHGADADLTRRLLAAGFRLRRAVQLQTFHLKVDTLGDFLRTMWRRGSTVRFGMKQGAESPATLARALLLSPWRWLLTDCARVTRLRLFGASVPRVRAWVAPWVNLLGGIVNALGRIRYYRRFRREGL